MASEEIKIEDYSAADGRADEYKFKVVVVGDSGVGKTNLIHRFVKNNFNENTKATVGVEFLSKTFKIKGDVFKIEVWDTAGQERYKAITASYYKGSNGALIVYDLTRESSFNNIEKWAKELKDKVGDKICLIMVGNKNDLKDEIVVKSEEALEKAKMMNFPFMETSALDGNGVKEAFFCLIRQMYDVFIGERKKEGEKEGENFSAGVELKQPQPKKKSGCC